MNNRDTNTELILAAATVLVMFACSSHDRPAKDPLRVVASRPIGGAAGASPAFAKEQKAVTDWLFSQCWRANGNWKHDTGLGHGGCCTHFATKYCLSQGHREENAALLSKGRATAAYAKQLVDRECNVRTLVRAGRRFDTKPFLALPALIEFARHEGSRGYLAKAQSVVRMAGSAFVRPILQSFIGSKRETHAYLILANLDLFEASRDQHHLRTARRLARELHGHTADKPEEVTRRVHKSNGRSVEVVEMTLRSLGQDAILLLALTRLAARDPKLQYSALLSDLENQAKELRDTQAGGYYEDITRQNKLHSTNNVMAWVHLERATWAGLDEAKKQKELRQAGRVLQFLYGKQMFNGSFVRHHLPEEQDASGPALCSGCNFLTLWLLARYRACSADNQPQ